MSCHLQECLVIAKNYTFIFSHYSSLWLTKTIITSCFGTETVPGPPHSRKFVCLFVVLLERKEKGRSRKSITIIFLNGIHNILCSLGSANTDFSIMVFLEAKDSAFMNVFSGKKTGWESIYIGFQFKKQQNKLHHIQFTHYFLDRSTKCN